MEEVANKESKKRMESKCNNNVSNSNSNKKYYIDIIGEKYPKIEMWGISKIIITTYDNVWCRLALLIGILIDKMGVSLEQPPRRVESYWTSARCSAQYHELFNYNVKNYLDVFVRCILNGDGHKIIAEKYIIKNNRINIIFKILKGEICKRSEWGGEGIEGEEAVSSNSGRILNIARIKVEYDINKKLGDAIVKNITFYKFKLYNLNYQDPMKNLTKISEINVNKSLRELYYGLPIDIDTFFQKCRELDKLISNI